MRGNAVSILEEKNCSDFCSGGGCAAGYQCPDLFPGIHWCLPPGEAGFGASCEHALDCATNVCTPSEDGSFCSEFCSRPADCPSDYTCTDVLGALPRARCMAPGSAPFGASCDSPLDCASLVCLGSRTGPLTRAFGASCTVASECQGGVCVDFGNGGRCTQFCDTGAVCPNGSNAQPLSCLSLTNGRQICDAS